MYRVLIEPAFAFGRFYQANKSPQAGFCFCADRTGAQANPFHRAQTGAAYWEAFSAGADALLLAFGFLGFLTCFSVGGEYELTELETTGAAGWPSATEAPTTSERPVKIRVSLFMVISPLLVSGRCANTLLDRAWPTLEACCVRRRLRKCLMRYPPVGHQELATNKHAPARPGYRFTGKIEKIGSERGPRYEVTEKEV